MFFSKKTWEHHLIIHSRHHPIYIRLIFCNSYCMGRRSSFDKIPKDLYRTIDKRAVDALLPHLKPRTRFAEPCVGHFDLVRQLQEAGHFLYWASDIQKFEPQVKVSGCTVSVQYEVCDALILTTPLQMADCIITNPPWSRDVLHPMISHFVKNSKFTWLLFDAAWAYTKQSRELMKYCTDIVPVGRLNWIEGTKMQGKDDCSWYRFCMRRDVPYTKFWPRGNDGR